MVAQTVDRGAQRERSGAAAAACGPGAAPRFRSKLQWRAAHLRRPGIAALTLVLGWVGGAATAAGGARSRDFWVSIPAHDYAVPEGAKAFDLLVEMNELLGSTDPMLRDDVAYGVVPRWVYRQRLLTADEQRRLVDMWSANLRVGLGERGTDSVLRRSFSALDLSLLAALDNEAPFLAAGEYERLLGAALAYLEDERDTRGYDPQKGWMHAAGHTADLLKFLARSPRLAVADQRRLLDAVAEKCATFGEPFVWGEGERLAQVVRSVARRADLDRAAFEAWLAPFPDQNQKLWAAGPAVDVPSYVAVENVKSMLRAAHAALAMDGELPAGAASARDRLLETLARMR